MKTLKANETFPTPFGEDWPNAILSIDNIELDYLNQTATFRVDVYKDEQARTDKKQSFQETFLVNKDRFVANIDMAAAISTLKSQLEDYALTLTTGEEPPIYEMFE
jgi:hypothetical protein